MHAPDGFLNAATAVTTGAVSAGTLGVAVRQAGRSLEDRQVPLAGLAAAFVFAAQMINFPVAAGTTGHLLGGALVAVLLGPTLGALVVGIVVVLQALAFADGGLTALGYNVLNMAIVTSFGGWGLFLLLRRMMPKTAPGVAAAGGLAAAGSVVLSAIAFSLEWLFGATAPVPFDTVFGAMVGVHLLIGVGEGMITAMTIGAVLAVRPDLVHGARHLDPEQLAGRRRARVRTVAVAGVGIALVIAAVVSQFAASAPDGLERVAIDTGIADTARSTALDGALFADYATSGVDDPALSLAIAGIAGVVLALAVGGGLIAAIRTRASRTDRSTAGA